MKHHSIPPFSSLFCRVSTLTRSQGSRSRETSWVLAPWRSSPRLWRRRSVGSCWSASAVARWSAWFVGSLELSKGTLKTTQKWAFWRGGHHHIIRRACDMYDSIVFQNLGLCLKFWDDWGSDVVARGIDIPEVTAVVNYTAPSHIQTYIHRVGRTARAGKAGKLEEFDGSSSDRGLVIPRVDSGIGGRILRLNMPYHSQKHFEALSRWDIPSLSWHVATWNVLRRCWRRVPIAGNASVPRPAWDVSVKAWINKRRQLSRPQWSFPLAWNQMKVPQRREKLKNHRTHLLKSDKSDEGTHKWQKDTRKRVAQANRTVFHIWKRLQKMFRTFQSPAAGFSQDITFFPRQVPRPQGGTQPEEDLVDSSAEGPTEVGFLD